MITLVIVKNPFKPQDGREVKRLEYSGTLQDLLKDNEITNTDLHATVNGFEITETYEVKDGDFIVICPAIEKGGGKSGGKSILGIVAAWILTYKLTGKVAYVKDGGSLRAVDREFIHRFSEEDKDFTNLAFGIELGYTAIVYLALLFTYNRKAFHFLISIFAALEAIAMGNFVTYGHGSDSSHNNTYPENERFRNVLKEVQKGDDSFYRIYTSIGDAYSANNSFINNYSSVSFFHSLYNFEIDDFSLWTGLRNGSKSVSGNYRGKYQDLDNLLDNKKQMVLSFAQTEICDINSKIFVFK